VILRGQGLRSGSGPGVPITGSGPLRQRVNARHLLRCHAVRVRTFTLGAERGLQPRGKPFRKAAQEAGRAWRPNRLGACVPRRGLWSVSWAGQGRAGLRRAAQRRGVTVRPATARAVRSGLCPHRMHGLVIIRRPAWRLGPVGAGRRSDTPRRTEPASRRRPSTSDTATPGRRSPPPRGPRLTGRATW